MRRRSKGRKGNAEEGEDDGKVKGGAEEVVGCTEGRDTEKKIKKLTKK